MNRPPSIGEMCDGGMQARLHGPQGYLEDIADLLVGKLVKIGEQENFPQVVRHSHNCGVHQLLELLLFQVFAGGLGGGFHEIDKLPALLIAGADRGLKGIGGATRLGAHQVARFIGRDGEEPWAETSRRIELIGGLMHLKKSLLEYVFRRRSIA